MGASTYVAVTGSTPLAAASVKTLLLVNPAVAGFRLTELAVSFDAASAAAGVLVELYRVVTIGPAAGTAVTPTRVNAPLEVAAQSTAAKALTAEPTAVEVLRNWLVQPAGGLLIAQFPLGREPGAAGGGQRIGLRVTTPASVSPNAACHLEWEE